MSLTINEPVSVTLVYDASKQSIRPAKILWREREYIIEKFGYHHKEKQGETLFHIFSVATASTAFKLQLDTETLHWNLQEIYDESSP